MRAAYRRRSRSPGRDVGGGQVVGVGEEDHVVGPLSHQLGVVYRAGMGAQDPDRLVADLPPVAVGAVQEIPSPPLSNPGDIR
jgi:hypothetical protein